MKPSAKSPEAAYRQPHNPVADQTWMEHGSCAEPNIDPAIFYPNPRAATTAMSKAEAIAIAVCVECPVIKSCLAFALTSEFEPYGVWGGKRQVDLQLIRKKARKEAKSLKSA